jgi:putative transposase
VHLLPGSTDSSPSKRAGYHSEEEAKLTLSEFTEWLALEIVGAYHNRVHRMLGTTPAAAWAQSIAAGAIPAMPADPERFVIGFLPVIHRKLQRNIAYVCLCCHPCVSCEGAATEDGSVADVAP